MGCTTSSTTAVESPNVMTRNAEAADIVNEIKTHLRNLPHVHARTSPYQNQNGAPERIKLEDSQLCWKNSLEGYNPTDYHASVLLREPKFPWADVLDPKGIVFNALDQSCRHDRSSHEGVYLVNEANRPMNPRGRCGLSGRGLLGRYGPNHAADPVVTKWKRGTDGKKELNQDGDPILEFVAIQRKDTGDWAIPGGMVDPGENVSVTLKREFGEETMASMELSPEDQEILDKKLTEVFKEGIEIYSGYVDDIRNTDNAWMETVCVNFHDEEGTSFQKFKLAAGDDAGGVAWLPFTKDIQLYSTHAIFIETIYKMRLCLHGKN